MNKVEYSTEETKLIDDFNSSEPKSAKDWLEKRFEGIKKTIKDHYLKEQNYTCCFCRQRNKVDHNRAWDTEHIISRSSQPEFMFEPQNLCVVCIDCNTEKTNKNTLTRQTTRFPSRSTAYTIFHPHFDIYEEHLHVIVEGELYEYKTQKGLKTIRTYGLDRFLRFVDRPQLPDPRLKRLLQLAIMSKDSPNDYDSLELELLEHLALKRSETLGLALSVDVVKKIKGL